MLNYYYVSGCVRNIGLGGAQRDTQDCIQLLHYFDTHD